MEDFQRVKGVFQDAHQSVWLTKEVGSMEPIRRRRMLRWLSKPFSSSWIKREGLAVDENGVQEALQATSWPDVWRARRLSRWHIIPARRSEYASFSDKRVRILYGALKRKDYKGMLEIFASDLPEADLTTTFAYGKWSKEDDSLGYPYVADFRDYLQDFYSRQDGQKVLLSPVLYFISEVQRLSIGAKEEPL